MARWRSFLPFSASTTTLQATTYLFGISLFSISFLVFLNSTVSFVITDLIGITKHVGDIVGSLGFVDEIVALIACPAWGLLSDRLGVRWVAVLGYTIIGVSLFCFVQARAVWPSLVLGRIGFALGASAAATMVTAILPLLADGADEHSLGDARAWQGPRASLESDATITQERFSRPTPGERASEHPGLPAAAGLGRRPSALAGYVGLFTGCGALVALLLFLPLLAEFSKREGVTRAQAVTYSFYVVGSVAFLVAILVFFGLAGLKSEDGKGWLYLLGLQEKAGDAPGSVADGHKSRKPLPFYHLLLSSVRLGFTDSHIAVGYIGGFVARASTVAISLFIPLYVNAYYMDHGFCKGSPNDPSPELKEECRAAYVLASILTGAAQLVALVCAPVFGYLNDRLRWRGLNMPVIVASSCGVAGYIVFPQLPSPEYKNVDGRGGNGVIFLVVALLGVSQIGAIVCSLGSLGRGVLRADVAAIKRIAASQVQATRLREDGMPAGESESEPLLEGGEGGGGESDGFVSRVQLKGSIAGVYSLCGGVAILMLTKLGGYLFDSSTHGAPFYMMAGFNSVLLVSSLFIDVRRGIKDGR